MTIGIAASDFFCPNLSTIATVLGINENVAGVTLLAFGNGSPDVFSTFAAMNSHSGSLAIGELIGAATFITAVVAGSMAIVQPFKVNRGSFVRDVSFFIVAVAFSMVFLADGRLQLWESIVMICFYLVYVSFVILWHWGAYHHKRRKGEAQRESDPAFQRSITGGVEAGRPWAADADGEEAGEETPLVTPRGSSTNRSAPGLSSQGPVVRLDDDGDDNGLAIVRSSMRVNRYLAARRPSMLNSIRPSLVGALDFRASLFSTERYRPPAVQPHQGRRHSYDPGLAWRKPRYQLSSASDPQVTLDSRAAMTQDGARGGQESHETTQSDSLHYLRVRARAISEGRVFGSHPGQTPSGHAPVWRPGHADASRQAEDGTSYMNYPHTSASGNTSPTISISPSASISERTLSGPGRSTDSNLLAPPQERFLRVLPQKQERAKSEDDRASSSAEQTAGEPRPRPQLALLSGVRSPDSAPPSPFPMFTDSPMPMSAQDVNHPTDALFAPDEFGLPRTGSPEVIQTQSRPSRWSWLNIFPSPALVWATLFPMLRDWGEKSLWQRSLGIVAAPSVFLLAVTLPVVHLVGDDVELDEPTLDAATSSQIAAQASTTAGTKSADSAGPSLIVTEETVNEAQDPIEPSSGAPRPVTRRLLSDASRNYGSLGFSGDVLEQYQSRSSTCFDGDDGQQHQQHLFSSDPADRPTVKIWNRWLVGVQMVVGPIFLVLVIWANTASNPSDLDRLGWILLYTCSASLAALVLFMASTSHERPPRYHIVLCFIGFLVSVAWISTIANEVVGVLKAFGVVLGISDAILGLTIFAVGNSLGDLVADITVARLGYQVMALSACFGGPLMNILLGIGIGGLYNTLRHGTHHQGAPHYKPYMLEISSTLVISGATLLLTLTSLLIFVPLNGWRLDRNLGWGLVGLWTVSTVGNVAIEVTGWVGGDRSA